jgi:inhibitor of KinA sporulation pathway (predicted exonuclease)
MLQNLGLTFDGRHHSGLDDSINIARIALELINVRSYR